jgi:1-acyl-sn-glycerol-3-phosphate acyltransferase
MIPAKHTWLAHRFFRAFVPGIITYYFRDFFVEEMPAIEKDRPLLVLANHFSWWDGFTHFYLNMHYLHRRFYIMMLEEELKKRRFLRNVGAFSVNRGRKEVLTTLQYASEILQDPDNLLLLFPTGELQTLYTSTFPFQKGLERITRAAPADLQILFSFILPEYGPYPRPALHTYLKTYEGPQTDLAALEQAFQEAYHQVVAKQHERLA